MQQRLSVKNRLTIRWLGIALMELTAMAAQQLAPVSQWLPPDTIVFLELRRPEALLGPILDKPVLEAIAKQPAYQQLEHNPGFAKFLQSIKFFEGALGTNWPSALQTLTRGGVSLAIGPQNSPLLCIDSADEPMLVKLLDIIKAIAQMQANGQGGPSRLASMDFQGVTGWTFNGKETHAILGNRLIIANRPEGLKSVLERRNAPLDSTLKAKSTYQAAQAAAGTDPAAFLYVDLARLRQTPKLKAFLQQNKQNPLAALLFSGITETMSGSEWLAATLEVDKEMVVMRVLLDRRHSSPEDLAAFSRPSRPDEGIRPNLSVPRQIAALSFYRDLHGFYSAKDQLFPERTSGLIFFENMMGIFFSGRDLTEDVLAQLRPEIRLVVAEQTYDPTIGTPEVQLPSFAAVLQLRHPQEFDEVVEEAWQKALGLINFTRGQQALPGLIIDRPVHHELTFTSAHYSTAGIKDRTKIHQRFNFGPAIAMPGDYLILSSSEALARDLMDSLKRGNQNATPRLNGVHSLIEVEGGQLASILEANRDSLVRGNMIKKGKTVEESQTDISLLMTLAKSVKHLKLLVANSDAFAEARLEIKVNVP